MKHHHKQPQSDHLHELSAQLSLLGHRLGAVIHINTGKFELVTLEHLVDVLVGEEDV